MLVSKIKEIKNGRVITKDSKTKDEKIISIATPQWEGDIKIIDGTHFEMKAKGTDRWSWALHIGQADDHILNALKAKGVLKDNGRFFATDSKTKDDSLDEMIRKMAREKADAPLNDDGTIRTPQQAQLAYEQWYKIIKSRYKNDSRYAAEYTDSKTKDADDVFIHHVEGGYKVYADGRLVGTYQSESEAENRADEFRRLHTTKDSKTKDADTGFIRKCIFDPEYRKARHGIGASKQKVLGNEAYNFGSESVAQALGISAKIPKEANTKNYFGVFGSGYSDAARKFGEWAASYVTMDSKTKDATKYPKIEARNKVLMGMAMPQLKDLAEKVGVNMNDFKGANKASLTDAILFQEFPNNQFNGWQNGDSKDAIDPTKPKNIAAAKNLAKAQGQAASDGGPGSGQKGHSTHHLPDPSTHKERRKERANLQKYIENARRSGNTKEAQKHSQRLAHINSLHLSDSKDSGPIKRHIVRGQ